MSNETNTQLSTRKQAPIVQMIEERRADFSKLIADQIGLDRFMRVAMTTIGRNPDLQKCSPASLLAGMMDAAQLGLEIGGPLQEGWLIAYGAEAQFQPGYRGFISLLHAHDFIRKIEAHVVYERDEFIFEYGLEPKLVHRPYIGDDRGGMVGVYAIAWLANGATQFDVLSPDDVERAKKASRSSNGAASPWQKFTSEMWRKTAVKRLIKYLRLKGKNVEKIERALHLDEQDHEDAIVLRDVPGIDQPGRKLSLRRGEEKKAETTREPVFPVVDPNDSGPCQFYDADGVLCNHEGYLFKGTGHRCQRHAPEPT